MFTPISTRSVNAYRRQSVESDVSVANPHRLVEMLFEGAIVSIGAARHALERGDIKAKCESIIKAVRIIEEGLKSNLNLSEGGELAANLDKIYDYCVLQLTQANVHNDVAALEEVSKLLGVVSDGWKNMNTATANAQEMGHA
ncbi:flagellar export chaperone FliS [Hydrogenophaga soli]|nr:flagellar export chaperone FliS [Burkholderiaceae bacterium]